MSMNWKIYAESVIEEVFDDLDSKYLVNLKMRQPNSTSMVSAEETLRNFVHSGGYRRLLISGRPGSGKSFLLNRLAGTLAQQMTEEIEAFEFASITSSHSLPDFQPDRRTVIPILIRLNMFSSSDYHSVGNHLSIEAKIYESLTQFGLSMPVSDLLIQQFQFVILIDDLDEISKENESENLREIRRFIEKYSKHRFVLAGRKSAGKRFENQFRSYEIAGLDANASKSLIRQAAAKDQDILFGMLDKAEGLLEFLATPYFLLQCCDFWNDPGNGGFNIGRLLLICIDRLIARQGRTSLKCGAVVKT